MNSELGCLRCALSRNRCVWCVSHWVKYLVQLVSLSVNYLLTYLSCLSHPACYLVLPICVRQMCVCRPVTVDNFVQGATSKIYPCNRHEERCLAPKLDLGFNEIHLTSFTRCHTELCGSIEWNVKLQQSSEDRESSESADRLHLTKRMQYST